MTALRHDCLARLRKALALARLIHKLHPGITRDAVLDLDDSDWEMAAVIAGVMVPGATTRLMVNEILNDRVMEVAG